jgi:hypothetical protein
LAAEATLLLMPPGSSSCAKACIGTSSTAGKAWAAAGPAGLSIARSLARRTGRSKPPALPPLLAAL